MCTAQPIHAEPDEPPPAEALGTDPLPDSTHPGVELRSTDPAPASADTARPTAGAVYLGGQTSSPDFVTGALMTGASGTTTTDGFVVKLTFPALTLTPSTRRIAYGYDELNRLTGATESGASTASYAYAYDRAGNRTGVTTNGVAVAYTYSITDTVLNPGWNYDAVGNLLSDGTRTSTYDALGRMTSQLVGGGRTDYTYNGDGVLVRDARGVVVNQYAQDLAAPLPQVLQINQDSTYYGLDRLATDLVPFSRQWYLHDALGSTRQTVQGGGTLNAGRYDPWGAPIGNPIAPFGFAGELQGDGGLVYLRARWYTPQQGVFTSRDPFAGFPERPYSQHSFQYGYSNPVRFTDPSGKNPLWCAAIAVADSPIPGPADAAALGCLVVVGIAVVLTTNIWNASQGASSFDDCLILPFPDPDGRYTKPVAPPALVPVTQPQPASEPQRPQPTPPVQVPIVPCTYSTYNYGELVNFDVNDLSRARATWAKATLCIPLGKGTYFKTGWNGTHIEGRGGSFPDRGHMIARELGGRGIRENGVPLSRAANQYGSRMRAIEEIVKAAVVVSRDTVIYEVTPIYNDSNGPNPIPTHLHIYAQGSTVRINELIPNNP